MITCMGLIVGTLESVDYQYSELMMMCAKWLKNYTHLLNSYPQFMINGKLYFTVIDSYFENERLFIMCKMHDGFTKLAVSEPWWTE